ncbi:MAG: hypothetical protein K2X66_16430 [Cyanobacteria bacterium]|jgi:hypothetical protein|nr:hypothetical protein [Cyanobacteriota bacterium]
MALIPPPQNPMNFPHFQVSKDHTARTQRLIELKIRQFESGRIEDVKPHDLADLIKACHDESKAGHFLDKKA